MNETKVILLCGNRIALPVMRDLVFGGALAAVVIADAPGGFTEQASLLLKDTAIPVVIVNRTNFVEKIQALNKKYTPALGLMFSFSFKLPASVYKLPPKGFYNIHPGPLPGYRGPDPVFRQIRNREAYACITIHKVDDEFDTGQIVMADKIRLSVTDTHGMLTSRLAELATRLVGMLIKLATFDIEIPSRAQDNSRSFYYPRQSANDITINWETMDAIAIIALIQACNPWNKGAVTMLNNGIIRILHAYPVDTLSTQQQIPGTIISIDDHGVTVATINNGMIYLTVIYNEEGFLPASRLKDFLVSAGMRFTGM